MATKIASATDEGGIVVLRAAATSNPRSTRALSFSGFLVTILAFMCGVATMQTISKGTAGGLSSSSKMAASYQEIKPILRNPTEHTETCRFYLAESSVAPNAGLGMFAGTGLLKGDMVGNPDICIFVTDPPDRWTHLHSHTWTANMFFGQKEGRETRVACEGFGTIFNTMPETHLNTRIQSAIQQTTAGATRDTPNAGSTTHHFGVHGVALDVIPAGSELTINYFDSRFKGDVYKGRKRPQRTIEDLEDNGWCIDNIDIRVSTVPGAGRGAFVKRPLTKGDTVVPAPLQVFKDRAGFQKSKPEQLYVNYCLQPDNSRMLFYPYGPGVNLINHSSKSPNTGLRWSKNHMNHPELLEMSYEKFWEKVKPGSLILEVYALRDLKPGEELLMDYGPTWEAAWNAHVASWKAPSEVEGYVYPEDMDDTAVLRTVAEQKSNPYPPNLITLCNTPESRQRKAKHIEWWPNNEENWWWNMVYCHILERNLGDHGVFEYTVSLILDSSGENGRFTPQDLVYDASIPIKEQYVDHKVPRRAIRWIEKPFHDDEHLTNAFRQPIGFPKELVSDAWITENR